MSELNENSSANSKRIAKNTIFLYIRMLLTMAVSLYTSRVVLATLGIEDFGIYNVVGGVVTMFAFLNGTISGVTQRYLTYELGTGDKDKLKSVFNTAMCIHWIIAAIILLLAETIGLWFVCNKLVIPAGRLNAAIWVYQFSILSTIILIVSVPYNACIVAHEKMSAFAYISILEVILKLLVVYLLLLTGYDKLIFYSFLIFVVQLLIRVIYNEYCKRHFEESKCKFKIDKPLAKNMIGFTGWSLFGGFASVGLGQGINIILNLFFGPFVNSARAIAVQVENAVQGFFINFQMALNPQIIKNYASGNFIQLQKLVYASCRYSYYLLFIISLPILIETEVILKTWLTEVPEHTINFTRFTLLILLVDCMSKPIMTAANATGEIKKYQTIVGTILLMVVPLSYFSLLIYQVPEIVFGIYLVIVVVSQFVRLCIVKGLIGLSLNQYLHRVIKPVFLVSLFSIVFPLFIYFTVYEGIFRLLVIGVVSVVSTCLSTYILGINRNEKDIVKLYVSKIMKKWK